MSESKGFNMKPKSKRELVSWMQSVLGAQVTGEGDPSPLAAKLLEKYPENAGAFIVDMSLIIERQAKIIDRMANHLEGYWESDGKPVIAGKLISEARALTKQ